MSASPQSTPSPRTSNGRFGAGNPGGPGRPRGSVAAAAAALDQAAVDAHEELIRIVLDQARAGNLEATKLLWSRIWPARRSRPLAIDVPPIVAAADVAPAKARVAEAVLSGEISAHEARPVLQVIDAQRDQIDVESERRLAVAISGIMLETLDAMEAEKEAG